MKTKIPSAACLAILSLVFVSTACGKHEIKKETSSTTTPAPDTSKEKTDKTKTADKTKKEDKTEALNIKFTTEKVLDCEMSGLADAGYVVNVTYKDSKLTGKVQTVSLMASQEKIVFNDAVTFSKQVKEGKCSIIVNSVKKEANLVIILNPGETDQMISLNDPSFAEVSKIVGKSSLDLSCKTIAQLMEACE